jgi:hypothetical protein
MVDKYGDEVRDLANNPIYVDDNGYLDLYHATPKYENYYDIIKNNNWKTLENQNEIYFSNLPRGGEGFGKYVIHVKIKPKYVDIADLFRTGEAYFTVPIKYLKTFGKIQNMIKENIFYKLADQIFKESFLFGDKIKTPILNDANNTQYVEFYKNPDLNEFKKNFQYGARGILTLDGDMIIWDHTVMHHFILPILKNILHQNISLTQAIYVDPDLSVHGMSTTEPIVIQKGQMKNKLFDFSKFDQIDTIS